MTSPTPAAVNTAPKVANSIGSKDIGPTVSNILRASFKKIVLRFSFDMSMRMMIAIPTPMPTPAIELISVNNAKHNAVNPIHNAGINIFIPIF